ncbi:hypothetical protein Cantr_04525 [Candida viswanathii]|uniref:Uncharacterized protein n=1 Tax=Candida viswanathii TaxID=5486 RepID=A0A367XNX6_9ASCO|nr:hypothetical protein Cantr_04525 [Candida viswanathii]
MYGRKISMAKHKPTPNQFESRAFPEVTVVTESKIMNLSGILAATYSNWHDATELLTILRRLPRIYPEYMMNI